MAVITEEAFKAMEARAVEAEANLIRAAEAGNELVTKLRESKAARDSLYQERHELKQSLDNKIALMVSHTILDCIGSIYSWLSRFSTARGSCTGLVTVGPTKVFGS